MKHSFSFRLLILAIIFLLASLIAACGSDEGMSETGFLQTQAMIEAFVAGTKTAKWIPEVSKTPRPTWTPRDEAKEEATEIPVEIPTEIVHLLLPVFPGLPMAELVDTYSARPGAEGSVTEGDYFAEYQLLERPFGQEMNYLANIDLRAAEIAKDEEFIYVTIFLDESVGSFDAFYGVELDVDADGRGDILLIVDTPYSTEWTMDNVSICADLNGDVGGTDIPASDVLEGGDGFEALIFSVEQFTDPDLAFARINPDRKGCIQIAFKPDFLDEDPSFFWRVWADQGLKNPGAYYYQDYYSIEEAGSPMQNSEYFPLGAVYGVDNTCRMPFQIVNTGYEIGLCGSGGTDPTQMGGATLPVNLKTPGNIRTLAAKTPQP